ncbi:MAG: hypothetical protein B7Z55_03665 [Planctomycetales bacterium 12-60-4]|nr:MAG: hypothetical protein B7Z55_03665 [Planctomycetales bacterium 12-60-4]
MQNPRLKNCRGEWAAHGRQPGSLAGQTIPKQKPASLGGAAMRLPPAERDPPVMHVVPHFLRVRQSHASYTSDTPLVRVWRRVPKLQPAASFGKFCLFDPTPNSFKS